MTDAIHNDADPGHLSTGQRLCRSRFVLKSEVFSTPESSTYWLAQDRDQDEEVLLYFPPEAITDQEAPTKEFFDQISSWTRSADSDWHRVIHIDREAKPRPLVALATGPGVSLGKRLGQGGDALVWEDVAPLIEKLTQHLVSEHQHGQVHGRLSQDNIRFLPNDDVMFVGAQLDRTALQIMVGTSHRCLDLRPLESAGIETQSARIPTGVDPPRLL